MIFRQYEQVLKGTKTQTRRLVKPGELFKIDDPPYNPWPFSPTVLKDWRLKWRVGKTYAVQPGRGKKAVGRIRITEIRRERLQDISTQDIFAEGIGIEWDGMFYPITTPDVAIEQFVRLWDGIHVKPNTRWHDDPDVWVLSFEIA